MALSVTSEHATRSLLRVERTLLSAAFEVVFGRRRRKIKIKSKINIKIKSGGQECPPYTRACTWLSLTSFHHTQAVTAVIDTPPEPCNNVLD
jgi:hypothetical protein